MKRYSPEQEELLENFTIEEISSNELLSRTFLWAGTSYSGALEPSIPAMRIHDAICPSCGALVPPSASRCGFCGRYFE